MEREIKEFRSFSSKVKTTSPFPSNHQGGKWRWGRVSSHPLANLLPEGERENDEDAVILPIWIREEEGPLQVRGRGGVSPPLMQITSAEREIRNISVGHGWWWLHGECISGLLRCLMMRWLPCAKWWMVRVGRKRRRTDGGEFVHCIMCEHGGNLWRWLIDIIISPLVGFQCREIEPERVSLSSQNRMQLSSHVWLTQLFPRPRVSRGQVVEAVRSKVRAATLSSP